MPDLGSCPRSDGADGDEICDDATIGAGDGIPEIIIGARELQMPRSRNPTLGRG